VAVACRGQRNILFLVSSGVYNPDLSGPIREEELMGDAIRRVPHEAKLPVLVMTQRAEPMCEEQDSGNFVRLKK